MLTKTLRSSNKIEIVAVGRREILASTEALASVGKVSKYHGEIARKADGSVDLVAEMEKHPDALWIKVRAIEADHENDNGDFFSREEVLKSYKTFEGCPCFTNHENQKVENAKGKVVMAEWVEKDGSVYCTMFIDRKAAPALCRAIEEGYITDVSMGTQVDYSTCSVCGNKALEASSYCPHIKSMKGRSINGQKVFERNFGLKFIEISIVTDGACKECTIQEILDPQEMRDGLQKAASDVKEMIKNGVISKEAGQEEITKLNQAMDLLESVAKSMLDQRKMIDLEFLKDLTEVLADLQHTTDELVDQGYGSVGAQPAAAPPLPAPPASPEAMGAPAMQEQPTEVPNVITGPAGGVGKVTEPAAAQEGLKVLSGRIKDLQDKAKKILEESQTAQGGIGNVNNEEKFQNTARKLASIWANPSVKEFKTEVSEGDLRVVVGAKEVIGMRGTDKVAALDISSLEPDVKEALEQDPKKAASVMLDSLKAKFAMVKEAEKAPTSTAEQQQMTMEAQLESQRPPLHPRAPDQSGREMITEKQLAGSWREYEFHDRKDEARDQITEKQLQAGGNRMPEKFTRQDKPRDQITEVQLRDKEIKGNQTPADKGSEWVAGVSDQNQQITEGQLNDWKASDKAHRPEMITEKQLADQKEPWGQRIASVEDAKLALGAAMRAVVKTSIATGATPDEAISAIKELISSPENAIKAIGYANGVDNVAAKASRATILKRASFHGSSLKAASKTDVQDYLLGSVVDEGMTGAVGIKALQALADQKNASQKIADSVSAGLDDKAQEQEKDQSDLLREAASDKDEQVKVLLNAKDVKADPKDEATFSKAAFALATKVASASNIKVTKEIHVASKNDVVEVVLMGIKEPPKEDKKEEKTAAEVQARKDARQKLAQMPAGGMAPGPDPMTMGAPGGTTMPVPAPMGDPAATPPVSALGAPPGGPEIPGEGETEGEALPPGTICPACGSDNVDFKAGEINCNDCGLSGTITVRLDINNWPGTFEEKGPGKEEEGGLGEAGPGGPEAGGLPPLGLASTFKLTPHIVKMAGNKPVGSFCPHCSSSKVKLAINQGSGIGKCESCKQEYKVDTYVNAETKDLWGRIEWIGGLLGPWKAASRVTQEASKKDLLAKALKGKDLNAKFAKADLAGKAQIIADLHNEGLLP